MFLEYDWLVAASHWLRLGHKVLVALTEHFLKFVKQNYTKDFLHTLAILIYRPSKAGQNEVDDNSYRSSILAYFLGFWVNT